MHPLDESLDALSRESWVDPPSASLLLEQVVRSERGRARRRLLWTAPLMLTLGACVTYGALVRSSSFHADVELSIDGEPAGVHAVRVRVEKGRIQPAHVDLDGHGRVGLQFDVPDDVDPHSLAGMRVEVWLTSD